ncbi:MAG: hypothetical protein AAGC70_01820 [Pseudomonadota bacterium]
MTRRYAADTSVSVAKTRADLEVLLDRYGAESVMLGRSTTEAIVGWMMRERKIIIRMKLPDPQAEEFKRTPSRNKVRTREAAHAAWEQACRSRWRALHLAIKAKLEAVEVGITTFEEEFLAHIVMPDGRPVGEHVLPGVSLAYRDGKVTPLLEPPDSR